MSENLRGGGIFWLSLYYNMTIRVYATLWCNQQHQSNTDGCTISWHLSCCNIHRRFSIGTRRNLVYSTCVVWLNKSWKYTVVQKLYPFHVDSFSDVDLIKTVTISVCHCPSSKSFFRFEWNLAYRYKSMSDAQCVTWSRSRWRDFEILTFSKSVSYANLKTGLANGCWFEN